MHQDSFATALWSNQQQWRLALQPGNQALNDIAFSAGHDQPCISLSCASFKEICAWCLTPACNQSHMIGTSLVQPIDTTQSSRGHLCELHDCQGPV